MILVYQVFLSTNEIFVAIYGQAKESTYSHLFNKRGAWNKRGGGAKVAKSLNMELGINFECIDLSQINI